MKKKEIKNKCPENLNIQEQKKTVKITRKSLETYKKRVKIASSK